jgi:hypothetical protein
MTFKVCDVKADGSCFFRSIYHSAKASGALKHIIKRLASSANTTMTETEFVKNARETLAHIILHKKDRGVIKNLYKHLQTLDKATYKTILDTSFPSWFVRSFRTLPNTEIDFREKLAKNVMIKTHWVSEVEVTLIKRVIESKSSWRLRIINNNDQIPKTPTKKREIVIINVNEVHYMALLPIKTCPEKTKILNPQTNRCVNKTSCKGFELQLQAMRMSS